jgi:DNA-binding NarL/FixJ family response regulator
MLQVLVIEDHPLFQQALVQLLRSTLGAEALLANDAEQGLATLRAQTDIELVVMDLGLPGALKGSAAVTAVRLAHPEMPILVVSGSDDPDTVQSALAAGADAYIIKTASMDAFGQTLRQLVGNGSEVSQHRLTDRQREILRLLCEGLSNKEIGRKLDLSDATVKMHMTAVLRALGVSTRTQAALSARKLGLDVV